MQVQVLSGAPNFEVEMDKEDFARHREGILIFLIAGFLAFMGAAIFLASVDNNNWGWFMGFDAMIFFAILAYLFEVGKAK
jgi:hypothetical protein